MDVFRNESQTVVQTLDLSYRMECEDTQSDRTWSWNEQEKEYLRPSTL